jgi:hypothetical protein
MERAVRVIGVAVVLTSCAESRVEPRSEATAASSETTTSAPPASASAAPTAKCAATWRREPYDPCDVSKDADADACLSVTIAKLEEPASDEQMNSARLYCAVMIARCKKECGK